jgi:UDP-N-acetylglucosamine 1-carboxyvinyltransferase
MDSIEIIGGKRLRGAVDISGSKNSALPILAACLLAEGPCRLHRVPELSDIGHMIRVLETLGARCTRHRDGSMTVEVVDESNCHAPYDLVRKMRASVCVMGPLLGKRRKARVSQPGGCNIGDRPIDIHLRGFRALGAEQDLIDGDVILTADKGLVGDEIFLGGPFGSTVLGTGNVLMAAVLAKGTTVIECAACEPEVEDLARFLIAMGAKIEGAGTPRLTVTGVERLSGCEYHVIPDRIEAGTYMVAGAATNGEVEVRGCRPAHLMAFTDRLRAAGVIVEKRGDDGLVVASGRRVVPTDVVTQPYPGFPTDLQAQMMALLCLGDGNSIVTEKIYPDRFIHVAELNRMGAQIRKEGPTAIVQGVRRLRGAPVMASDLRASAALVIAGLMAEGKTTVNRVYHIDRGYERIDQKFAGLGAIIHRVSEEATSVLAGSEAAG